MARIRPLAALIGGVSLFAVACSSSDSLESTSPTTVDSTVETSAPPTTEAPPTTPAPTTAPPTTTPPTTAPPTTAPPTTAPPTTVPPTTEPPPTTAPEPATPAPATAFAEVDADLVELDVASGDIIRVVAEFWAGEAVFRGDLTLTPDRSTVYFGEAYEDGWYGCGSSVGNVGRTDLASGTSEMLYPGAAPALSADGSRLAFLSSTLCLPDPEQPEFWVLTPYDQVVVVDLATNEQVVITTANQPADYADPNTLDWVGFHPSGDLLVLTGAGDLHRVPSGAASIVQDQPVVIADMASFPIDMSGDRLVTVVAGDEGSTTLELLDLETGTATELFDAERYVAVGVSVDGHVVASDELTESPTTEGLLTVVVTDGSVSNIDW